MKLPIPGASYLENLVATMRMHGNEAENLDLERLAIGKPFGPDELLVEFKIQKNGDDRLPEEVAVSKPKSIPVEEPEE